VVRSQDNYVVQWGDPNAEDGGDSEGEEGSGEASKRRSLGEAKASLPPEMDRPIAQASPDGDRAAGESTAGKGEPLPFTPLGDPDVYAPEVGFTHGFPVARDAQAGASGRTWLAHCYAMVGVGRGDAADSGSGAELYVVIGHSPRHLDRNVTLVGRVVQGMDVLSTLPRGTGALGFYEDPAEYVPITSIRLGSELPEAERARIEVLRTDTRTFRDLIDARRWRREGWFLDKVGHVSLCNVPLPVRPIPEAPAPVASRDKMERDSASDR
jgi:peptidylprolyl isomerase